jgi:hypothetical protein
MPAPIVINGTPLNSTTIRIFIRYAVGLAVGWVVSYLSVHFGSLAHGDYSWLVPGISSLYIGAVMFLERKFPKLGWLLGLLPLPVTPTPAPPVPTPPAPTPAAPTPAAKATTSVKKGPAKK